MDLTTRKITNLVGNESGSIRFSNQSINQVYEDSRGLIWVGTREGLNLYNPKNDHLQVVPLSQNDSRVFITGIVEDDNKNMWVTTANGVVNVIPSIDTKTEIILSTIIGMMIRTVCRAVSSINVPLNVFPRVRLQWEVCMD